MSVYAFGPFQLDAERLMLLEGPEPVAAGPKVVETLLALVERPGEVLTKSAMLDRIWPEGFVEEANLAQNIYVLRKLLRDRWNVDAIETIPRRGYRFRAAVAMGEDLTAPAQDPIAKNSRSPRYAIAAAALLALLAGGSLLSLRSRPPQQPAPQQVSAAGERLYAIGHYYWNQRTRAGVTRSIDYFQRVVASDPRAAQGHAALASAYAIMGDYHYGSFPPKVYFSRATAEARVALSLDPRSGQAYGALAVVAMNIDRPREATADLSRALALDPSDASSHEWYGIALLQRGQLDGALRELRTAADLDPLSVSTTAWLSSAAYLARRYDDAIAYGRQTLDLEPHRTDVWQSIGLAYEAQGSYGRAVDAFDRYAAGCPMCRADADALLTAVYARERDFGKAREVLAVAQSHSHVVEPDDLALALAAMGERRVALSWLRRMPNAFLRMQIANDSRFDALRNDLGYREPGANRPA